MAISTYGVVLRYGSTTPTTEVIIKDFPSLLGKRSSLETTTLKDDAQTFIAGTASVSANEGSVDAVLEMTISVTPSTVPVWAKDSGS